MRACLRLSLLTGATWVLSLLAEGLDLDWLRALSIVTNGGQGALLLLLSYVTARLVLAMLAAKLGCGKDDVAAPSTGTSCASGAERNWSYADGSSE